MPYFNGNNTINAHEFELMLNMVKNTIIKYKNMNKEIIVCGDFNTDFSKDNVFTTMLIEAINTTQLIPADLVLHQTAQYTFMRKYKKRIITSWIDHVLVSSIENVNYLNIMQQLNTNTKHK